MSRRSITILIVLAVGTALFPLIVLAGFFIYRHHAVASGTDQLLTQNPGLRTKFTKIDRSLLSSDYHFACGKTSGEAELSGPFHCRQKGRSVYACDASGPLQAYFVVQTDACVHTASTRLFARPAASCRERILDLIDTTGEGISIFSPSESQRIAIRLMIKSIIIVSPMAPEAYLRPGRIDLICADGGCANVLTDSGHVITFVFPPGDKDVIVRFLDHLSVSRCTVENSEMEDIGRKP